jgi:hypothetical protein
MSTLRNLLLGGNLSLSSFHQIQAFDFWLVFEIFIKYFVVDNKKRRISGEKNEKIQFGQKLCGIRTALDAFGNASGIVRTNAH